MHAIGRLQHHFWGEYCADIVVAFDTPQQAELARTVPAFADWRRHTTEPRALCYHAKPDAVESTIAMLVAYGADPKAIDSVAHSIDYGDTFHIDVAHCDNTQQLDLLS